MSKKLKQFSLIRFSKKVVLFCLIFITIYTITAIVFQAVTGDTLSDTLTERIFTCLIGELAITGILRISEFVLKAKFGTSMDDNENSEFSGVSFDNPALADDVDDDELETTVETFGQDSVG